MKVFQLLVIAAAALAAVNGQIFRFTTDPPTMDEWLDSADLPSARPTHPVITPPSDVMDSLPPPSTDSVRL
ncbi:hypothetical protein GN244_ATG01988 [Phytophthora infestans]|uniref:Secreted RxLR effector peptide protein n=1 Tax=Phytophthora infestans TaxID=4787 RepID=A0A833TFA7_PHYIN|nr:hypothetical protein GN244_ATG01988 [Phytophthora infestans]KAF4144392.1 hypothetical protein GN958_ATG06402 [Phytophthora infestans]